MLNDKREGLTRDEMLTATGMDSTVLTKVLRNLERCDFVIRYSQFGNKNKGAIYRLVDFYTLFYYRFVEGFNGQDEEWWSHNLQSRSVGAWQGFSFELVCFMHLRQMKRSLGIGGISTEASAWRYVPPKAAKSQEKGTQVDLLIDRADRVINLCEMKFSEHPYRITEDYEKLLRDRMETFRTQTKTTKSLVHTFVTTFGVADGMYRSIVNSEVTMDGLFES